MKKGFTLIELVIVVTIIAIPAVTIVSQFNLSTGQRSGVVVKMSNEGIISKSWEGELMLGSGNSGQTWDFSIDNRDPRQTEFADQLSAALTTGKKTTVFYRQGPFLPWHRDTSYRVTEVRTEL